MGDKTDNPKKNPATTWNVATTILSILFTNAVPIYGVVCLGWDSTSLVLVFILESLLVLVTDIAKSRMAKPDPNALVIEIGFILFFGFFALLVYGPYDSFEGLLLEGFKPIKNIVVVQLAKPLLVIAVIRLIRLFREYRRYHSATPDKRQPLELEGGRWALLLFFVVVAAPLFAHSGPSPFGGLLALALFKTVGELLFVWLSLSKWVKTKST